MALSGEHDFGMQLPANVEFKISEATPEVILKEGVPVSLGKPLTDEVGSIDWTAFAERKGLTPDNLSAQQLYGFAAYQKAGGIFSKDLYKAAMDGVIELQKPGERENSKFTASTETQIKSFEDRHNKPFPATLPPPIEKFFLTETQKDAYRLLRENRLVIPGGEYKMVQVHIELSDNPLFEQILKMPSLESYKLSNQEQSQTFTEAA